MWGIKARAASASIARGGAPRRPHGTRGWSDCYRRIFVSAERSGEVGCPYHCGPSDGCWGRKPMVESRCGAVAVGWAYLFPPLSSGGASLAQPWLRFHIPLIEPDVQISRIRLSDKGSRLRPRLAAPARGQAYQAKMAVQVREWIGPAPSSPDLVLETQPPAQPHRCVVVESAIRP